jgi:hypothetical protein
MLAASTSQSVHGLRTDDTIKVVRRPDDETVDALPAIGLTSAGVERFGRMF